MAYPLWLPPPGGLRLPPFLPLPITLKPKSKDRSALVYLRPPLPLPFLPVVFFAIDHASSGPALSLIVTTNVVQTKFVKTNVRGHSRLKLLVHDLAGGYRLNSAGGRCPARRPRPRRGSRRP